MVESPEAVNRAADRRILEYFISLNAGAADHWEATGRGARHPDVRNLLAHTAAMERKVARQLAGMLPRFLSP